MFLKWLTYIALLLSQYILVTSFYSSSFPLRFKCSGNKCIPSEFSEWEKEEIELFSKSQVNILSTALFPILKKLLLFIVGE